MALREEKAVKRLHKEVDKLYRRLAQASGPKEEEQIEKQILRALTEEDLTERRLRRVLKMSA